MEETSTNLEALGSTSSTKNNNDDDERILGGFENDIEQEKDALSSLLLLSTNDTNQQQTFCENADNSKNILNDDDDDGDSYDGFVRTKPKDIEDEQDNDNHDGDDISDHNFNKNEFKHQSEKAIEPSPSNKLSVGSKCFKFDQIVEVPQGGRDDTFRIALFGGMSNVKNVKLTNTVLKERIHLGIEILTSGMMYQPSLVLFMSVFYVRYIFLYDASFDYFILTAYDALVNKMEILVLYLEI